MAVTSARIVNMKEKGIFEQNNETERTKKYTLGDEVEAHVRRLQISGMPRTHSLRVLTMDDKEAVLQFMRKWFFLDEPLNNAVQLLETSESRCEELEEYTICSLDDGVSVAAVDADDQIVGILVNGIASRKEAENQQDKSEECPNPKFRRILKVLSHLDQHAKIWDHLPACLDKVVEVRIASTHEAWRGQGLMRKLCAETERLAKSVEAAAIRMDTTSAFSAAAAERLGYKQIYKVPYKQLEYAPQPPAPHLEARVYIKKLY